MARPRLLDLQDELLERVLLNLPQGARARVAAVCKRLYQLTITCPRTYGSLIVNMGDHNQAERFMVWLARKRHLVRHLSLSSDAPDTLATMRHRVQLDAALVGAACHPGLLSLDLELSSPVALGGWAASLSGLRFLDINCPLITISNNLSQLTRLTSMSLSTFSESNYFELLHDDFEGATLVLDDGCLPSSLKSLHLSSESDQLPPVVFTATQLTQLVAGGIEMASERLGPLQQLKSLCALGLEGLVGLPEALTALTALTTLCIQHRAMLPDSVEGLAALTRLKELSLRHLSLTSLPAAVHNLPQLTYLDLCGNPFAGPLVPTTAPLLGRLATLALPAAVASANLVLLPRLTALTALEVSVGNDTDVAEFQQHSKFEQLLFAAAGLASLGCLRTLCISSEDVRGIIERHAVVVEFAPGRPVMFTRTSRFPQPPGLQPHTWYPEELKFRMS